MLPLVQGCLWDSCRHSQAPGAPSLPVPVPRPPLGDPDHRAGTEAQLANNHPGELEGRGEMGSHVKQGSKPLAHALRSRQALLTQQIQKMESLKILSQQSQSIKPQVWGLSECGALCDCDLRLFSWNCHQSRTREAHVIFTVNTSVQKQMSCLCKGACHLDTQNGTKKGAGGG